MAPFRNKKVARKEKPKRDYWTVVNIHDVTNSRYPFTNEAPGWQQDHAERLTSSIDNQWAAVKVKWLSEYAKPQMPLSILLAQVKARENVS